MSPSAAEEGGKVATSFVETMKSQPLALALVVVNVCFLGFGFYFLHDLARVTAATNERKDQLMEQLVATVAKCTTELVPPHPQQHN